MLLCLDSREGHTGGTVKGLRYIDYSRRSKIIASAAATPHESTCRPMPEAQYRDLFQPPEMRWKLSKHWYYLTQHARSGQYCTVRPTMVSASKGVERVCAWRDSASYLDILQINSTAVHSKGIQIPASIAWRRG
jgi:hypothetical protein